MKFFFQKKRTARVGMLESHSRPYLKVSFIHESEKNFSNYIIEPGNLYNSHLLFRTLNSTNCTNSSLFIEFLLFGKVYQDIVQCFTFSLEYLACTNTFLKGFFSFKHYLLVPLHI